MSEQVSVQESLIFVMVTMCIADSGMDQIELRAIRTMVEQLPVFEGFPLDNLPRAVSAAVSILQTADGPDRVVSLAALSLPPEMHETAYALAVEIAAADVEAKPEEMRLLEMMRDGLHVSPLAAAAIEHSARVRYRRG